ncbi:hypothetical protein FN846DRAFT_941083 [Sphaerosporella brunnea]|uniref:Stress-response A/B barrel domain-containing protein n=1 Tax=Sphaerosporella brunnea TaxID=1250544 RepID=A0A5J5F253_9PEZI|nr:hypothetical protein FN846DRAFT_941083 [Sphaerosporella brunnea]
MAPVTHIVAIKFTQAQAEVAASLTTGFFALKDLVRNADGEPFILSIRGGPDCSIEGLQKGFTHLFVVDFASVEDRDWYVQKDPEHAKFATQLVEAVGLDNVIVLDFQS